MMWGPAVARIAADLALEGHTDLIDIADLGMDRFDDQGHSKFYDPVALPFPPSADDED
jgi:sarcosine oxidase subunit beta